MSLKKETVTVKTNQQVLHLIATPELHLQITVIQLEESVASTHFKLPFLVLINTSVDLTTTWTGLPIFLTVCDMNTWRKHTQTNTYTHMHTHYYDLVTNIFRLHLTVYGIVLLIATVHTELEMYHILHYVCNKLGVLYLMLMEFLSQWAKGLHLMAKKDYIIHCIH